MEEVADQGPPAPRWRWQWSIGAAFDIAAVIFLIAATLTWFRGRPASYETVVLVVLPLLLRRFQPIPVLAVTAVGCLATRTSADVIDILAVAIAAYTVGDLVADRTTSAATVLLTAFGLSVGFIAQGQEPGPSLVLPAAVILPSWIVGTLVRGVRVEAAERDEARRRVIADREAALHQAIADQRRTIARELHDVVAHAVSVMVVQAGAARSVLATSPADAERALLAVESTGREAMAELRRLLDVLADEHADPIPTLAPQSGLAQLDALVLRVRDAGLPAELEVDGSPRPLPADMDVTVYRIVQEALTNALRYAGRARTVVRLRYEPSEVRVEVVDDGPGRAVTAEAAQTGTDAEAGTKRGIIGMRERAAVFGGRVEAGLRGERGYAVRVWLPTPVTPPGALPPTGPAAPATPAATSAPALPPTATAPSVPPALPTTQ